MEPLKQIEQMILNNNHRLNKHLQFQHQVLVFLLFLTFNEYVYIYFSLKDIPRAFSPLGGPLCPHKKKIKKNLVYSPQAIDYDSGRYYLIETLTEFKS